MPAMPIIARRPLLSSLVAMDLRSLSFVGLRPSGSKPRSPGEVVLSMACGTRFSALIHAWSLDSATMPPSRHERLDGLALDVAEHHGEAQPEAAGEARLLERHVGRRVNARERVVLLEEETDRRKHGDAAVLDFASR